ncbi:MAG: 4-(cytidine 5'-diphospho)-2-C-methyl-D-erythritol kinase [Ferrovum sp.]|nr:4-(cytidine 5'-diphospho)-2-C-methyl-D-erythritol kinase [Ferrovum sp.]NDU87885.1 4-(cytidine 5'-diphospho)-2-C-methyl-D-erythritol kinase [Ferrovum sp.]
MTLARGVCDQSQRQWLGAPAPAKLNLFLRVTGRRADGYHTLQTLFTFLDYGDTLDVMVTEDGSIGRQSPVIGVREEDDLSLRAARLLQQEAQVSQGAQLRLYKHIPVGGGLGGGSSDAATTLLVLNRLWGLRWEPWRLAQLGLKLGADVPVFVWGQTALATGVGEELTPLTVPERWYLVVSPGVFVSTAAVFAAPDLTRNSNPVKIRDFSEGITGNDLQPVVERLYPEVARLLRWLGKFGEAHMSGSGSCCFLVFSTAAEAQQVKSRLPSDYRGFVARGRQCHPLFHEV